MGLEGPACTWAFWGALVAISACNIIFLAYIVVTRANPDRSVRRYVRIELSLALPVVFLCGYRCTFPFESSNRLVLFDTAASSVLLGRLLSCIAEMCFVSQIVIAILHVRDDIQREAPGPGVPFVHRTALAMICVLCLAELTEWYAVFTRNDLVICGVAVLWAVIALLVVVSCAVLIQYMRWVEEAKGSSAHVFCWTFVIIGALMFVFSLCFEVPRHWQHYQQCLRDHIAPLPLWEGIRDAATRRVQSDDFSLWRNEFLCMLFRFGPEVWVSILLVSGPRMVSWQWSSTLCGV